MGVVARYYTAGGSASVCAHRCFYDVLVARRGTSVAPPTGHRINLMGHGDDAFQYVLVKYTAEVQH